MKLKQPANWEEQNSRQQAKHAQLYSDLPQTRKRNVWKRERALSSATSVPLPQGLLLSHDVDGDEQCCYSMSEQFDSQVCLLRGGWGDHERKESSQKLLITLGKVVLCVTNRTFTYKRYHILNTSFSKQKMERFDQPNHAGSKGRQNGTIFS